MEKNFLLLFFLFFFTDVVASDKKNIIQNLNNIKTLSFDFEQNINGKIENGNCTIQYPKKIFCKYNLGNKKILVSNACLQPILFGQIILIIKKKKNLFLKISKIKGM